MHCFLLVSCEFEYFGDWDDYEWDEERTPERSYHDYNTAYVRIGDQVTKANGCHRNDYYPNCLEEVIEINLVDWAVVLDFEYSQNVSEDKGACGERANHSETWITDNQALEGETHVGCESVGLAKALWVEISEHWVIEDRAEEEEHAHEHKGK